MTPRRAFPLQASKQVFKDEVWVELRQRAREPWTWEGGWRWVEMSPEVRVESRFCEDRGVTAVRLRGWGDDPELTDELIISVMIGERAGRQDQKHRWRLQRGELRQELSYRMGRQVRRLREQMLTQVAVNGVDLWLKTMKERSCTCVSWRMWRCCWWFWQVCLLWYV